MSSSKLPHRHVTDSSDVIKAGSKRLGENGENGVPPATKLRNVPAFKSAHEKLAKLVAAKGDQPLRFAVLGPIYLAQRR